MTILFSTTFAITPYSPSPALFTTASIHHTIMSEIQPNQTLYLQNLPDKIHLEGKIHTPSTTILFHSTIYAWHSELRTSLYHLFATYGDIIDIVTKKEASMREQAFIVYDNVAAATTALRSLNGFSFYQRPMVKSLTKWKTRNITLDRVEHHVCQDQVVRCGQTGRHLQAAVLGREAQSESSS